jgi:hypothetical protein
MLEDFVSVNPWKSPISANNFCKSVYNRISNYVYILISF